MPDRYSQNYYHFLILMVANLQNLEFEPETIYIDLKEHCFRGNNYITEILGRLYPSARIIHSVSCPSNCLQLPQYPEPVSRESGVNSGEYMFLRNLFLPLIKAFKPENTYSEYIYISRTKDSSRRRLVNESDIFKDPRFSKFQVITMSDYSVLEQMWIFNNAKVIIGVHGAALANMIFCDTEKAKIIEIVSERMSLLNHFEHIATTLNIVYSKYKDAVPVHGNDYESDIEIKSIDKLYDLI